MLPILGMLASAGLDLVNKFIDAGKDKAVEVIKEKTGIDLTQKKTLSQEDIQKLKEFQEKEKEFLLKQIELANQDRADARSMQREALKQDSWFAKNFIYLFAIAWSVFAFAYIGFITFGNIPQQNIRFADTILGFLLGTALAGILQFFYGSSLGSKIKDEKMFEGK
jgi:hypothetical protein